MVDEKLTLRRLARQISFESLDVLATLKNVIKPAGNIKACLGCFFLPSTLLLQWKSFATQFQ